MPTPTVTVVIPTLAADDALADCVRALERQTWRDLHVIIVDNSGRGLVRRGPAALPGVTVLENERNEGFGGAVNRGFRHSASPFLATLNDDTVPDPRFVELLLSAMRSHDRVGMCAPRILLRGQNRLDSAGMLVCADGSSRQRGHSQPPDRFTQAGEALLPSGCAALYSRAMLDEVGLFDEEFFLYCEDTDLGLRGRWAGWDCRYVPEAVVEHRYSHSAGRVSPLKAYYVERNRLAVLVKNYPARSLWAAPLASVQRYAWHAAAVRSGEGAAGRFRREGNGALTLAWMVVRAHLSLLRRLPRLLRERRAIQCRARVSPSAFAALLRRHAISPREVAAL